MSKAKKVIFVIVEGPTDEDALSSVLKQIFSSAEVHFHVIYGDITTEDAITANNAKSYVAKRIAAEMKKYAYSSPMACARSPVKLWSALSLGS